MKAIDYYKAFQFPRPSDLLPLMMNTYVFEKTLCKKVAHLSRVSHAIADGAIDMDPNNPFAKVEYLIFELAESDVRKHLDMQADLDVVFVLRVIHEVATGLSQLHGAEIAHQDLKPSNVLLFPANGGSKICDLGRAWDRNMPSPHDLAPNAGDPSYKTIEAMYNAVPMSDGARRFGCDMFHLGSLVVFLFARAHINALVLNCLDISHRPGRWGGAYAAVLPFLQAAFDVAVDQSLDHMPECIRGEMKTIVGQLCDPNPARRGHPLSNKQSQFSLERYISRFDWMAKRAELDFIAKARKMVESAA